MNLKLRTLTPLHIGDGSTLHAFDYTVLDGRFYRCSPRFFEQLLEMLGGDASEKFVRWSGGIMDEMTQLDQDRRLDPRRGRDFNQRLSELKRQHNLRDFAKTALNQEQAFLAFLREKAPSIPMQRSDRPKQEYRGFQRGGDGTPFIPGSSVKGCIRTALLYHFLKNHPNQGEIEKILVKNIEIVKKDKQEAIARKFRFNPTRHLKKFGEELEQLAFFAEMTNEKGVSRKQEAQNDLMRCLLVADTLISDEAMGMENVDLYLVKKLPKSRGGSGDFESQRQTQAPAVEAVLPGQTIDVKIDFNIELLLQLHRNDRGKGLQIGRETHFIGWRERAKTLFNLTDSDFESVPVGANATHAAFHTLQLKAFSHILTSCREFSNAQVDALTRWSDNFVKHARDKYMARDIETGTASVLDATGTRLHLGFATGFEGMTVVLHLLAHHKRRFAEIMDLFGIGDSPSAWRNRRPGQYYQANPDRFPTSRRMATSPGAIVPLGWLEWADDPKAKPLPSTIRAKNVEKGALAVKETPPTPTGPVFLRGKLKPGAELDAELLSGGNPGKFKLFIREDYMPEVEVRYAAGFKVEDVGRIVRVRVKDVNKKGEVLVVEFIKYFQM